MGHLEYGTLTLLRQKLAAGVDFQGEGPQSGHCLKRTQTKQTYMTEYIWAEQVLELVYSNVFADPRMWHPAEDTATSLHHRRKQVKLVYFLVVLMCLSKFEPFKALTENQRGSL